MPDKRLEEGPDGDELTSAPITKPPQPLVIKVLNWLNFSGSSNFFFRCEEVHLFLLHYSLIFLNGNPEYNVCLLLLEIGRMQIHVHVHGGLLCQSELRCMGLIRPWFCSKSAALALLSICYVIHVFFYAYQLLCS